ncbi:MAG TPA: hypothetical protein VH969_02885 [Actinophytocola sp.]|jgi:hypothetical protein|uniref:hypothetical protein n=1 Tax=Actinophytocola sp. TaxID=1872138 RepID=UPI002F932024
MTFNIHNQHANVINQAAGNQWISGGQHVTVTTLDAARSAVDSLRQVVRTLPLDQATSSTARTSVDELGTELRKHSPAPPVVEGHLRRLTSLLKSTGALVTAGATLIGPLQVIAGWLGDLGASTLQLLS